MKVSGWRWLAASSLLLVLTANAETRPQYGGMLRMMMREAPATLDPADNAQPDSFARRNVTLLIFDTLVTIGENSRVQPSLAVSWQAAGNQGWKLRLRRGVKFQDGSPLTADEAAASLRAANSSWQITVEGDSLLIENSSSADLPAELALGRNAIVKRNPDGSLSGTGPFQVSEWQPGKKLILSANEDCWRGRPFLDGVELEMAKSFRDQMAAAEMGKADLIEVAPEQEHRISPDAHDVLKSMPVQLLALLFTHPVASNDEKVLRDVLALSVERGSIRNVLLQGAGQPAGGILPTWMSGYGFIFPTEVDLTRARQLRAQFRSVPTWTIGYDPSDPLGRLIADRIALNAKDAGLQLQPTSSAPADVRLVQIPMLSSNAWIALAGVAEMSGSPMAKSQGSSAADLYSAEQAVLAARRVIPLSHLPVTYAGSPRMKSWTVRPEGTIDVSNAWLGSAR